MKKYLAFPAIFAITLIGGGCNRPSTPTIEQPQLPAVTQPEVKPVVTEPTPTVPTSDQTWKVFTDNQLGYQLKYPVQDAEKTWAPSSGKLDLSAFPKHDHIHRELTVEAKRVPAGIACPEKDQIKNALGTLFCKDATSEGAAGSIYETYNYRTIVNGTIISLNLVVKHLTDPKIVADCEQATAKDAIWETQCRPFDPVKDLAVMDEIIASVGSAPISDTVSFTTAEISKKKEGVYEVKVSFPQIDKGEVGLATAFNAAVRNPLQKEVDQHIADALKAEKDKVTGPGMWTLDMEPFAIYQSPRLINSFLAGSVYTGGAHPNMWYQNVIMDRATKKSLRISDIFIDAKKGLTFLSEASRKTLKMNEDAMGMSDQDWLKTGTEAKDENYSQTRLTEQGLVITFPAYQVAAYAAGPQEVKIPWKDIQSLIKPEYLPAAK